jgi:archaemetzincin
LRQLVAALALLSAPALAQPTVYLQPLGAITDADVRAVEGALTAFYPIEVKTLARVELPKEAWYAPRKRWRADRLLEFLAARKPDGALRILGLTDADISTTKGKIEDWGVMGLASLDGASGVISRFRCAKRASGAEHARIRLAKTAVHEIGHTLGLPHCPNRGCIMEDAEGSVLTCDREYDLCADCRAKLVAAGHPARSPTVIPWPRP